MKPAATLLAMTRFICPALRIIRARSHTSPTTEPYRLRGHSAVLPPRRSAAACLALVRGGAAAPVRRPMAGAGQWAVDDGSDECRAALATDPSQLAQLMDELSFFAHDGTGAAGAAAASQHGRADSGGAAEARRGAGGSAPPPQRAPHADPGRAAAADVDALLATCRDGRALLRELNERLLVRT